MPGRRNMARSIASLLVCSALVVGACSTGREVTEPEPKPVTETLLGTALLTTDDLPDTFTEASPGTPIDDDVIAEHGCDDALADLDPKESVTADFTGSGTRLTSTVAYFPGAGAAVEGLYRQVGDGCAAVVATDEGVSLITRSLNFGVLSDDTFPLQFELERADGTFEERDLIVMRIGDLVSIVRLNGPRPSDKVLLDRVVRVAIGRLGLVADETT